jgi:hypothetical protein
VRGSSNGAAVKLGARELGKASTTGQAGWYTGHGTGLGTGRATKATGSTPAAAVVWPAVRRWHRPEHGGGTGQAPAVPLAVPPCPAPPLSYFLLIFLFSLKTKANFKLQNLEFGNSDRHETNFVGN